MVIYLKKDYVLSEEIDNRSSRKNLLKGYNMLLYFAGSMVTYEPTEECIMELINDGSLNNLPVKSSNPRFITAASHLRSEFQPDNGFRETLIRDHRKLFSAEGLHLAKPMGSEYLSSAFKSGIYPEVSEFYDSYGWYQRKNYNIPDDHLGIEFLFLTILIDKYLLLDDDPCCCAMQKEITRFIEEHLLSWIPEWNRRVIENADSEYYKGVSDLLLACTEDLYDLFKVK